MTTTDPLVDSVAEHASVSTDISFLLHSVWMIFAGIGVWFLLSKKTSQNEIFVKNDMKAFVLIMGVYIIAKLGQRTGRDQMLPLISVLYNALGDHITERK